MAAQILGGGRSSRLYKRLVYEKQIAQSVDVYQQSLILGSAFQIEVIARPGHTADELEKAVDDELAALRTTPPTTEELERARNSIETAIVGGFERLGGSGGIADRLNSYNHYVHDPGYLEQDIRRYRAVTSASVLSFVKAQLRPDARVIVHAVPGTPAPLSQLPSSAAASSGGTVAAEAINVDEPWRNTQPEAGAVKSLTLATPVTETLSNGLMLVLSERHEVPMVAANLVFRDGSGVNPLEKPGLVSFTTAMLDEGTTSRSALMLADELALLGASLSTASSMDAVTVSARSLSKNFAATLALLADVSLHPSFPAAEIDRERASRLAQLVQQRDNPTQLAGQLAMTAVYGARHPYGFSEIGTDASVKALTRADVEAVWKQHFVPNNAALVVAGDITMSELRGLAEKMFGTWGRGSPAPAQNASPAMTSARVVIVDTPGSAQTQLQVAGIGAERSTADFRALQVLNLALGGSFSSRINLNLRETHGYTYGARSQFTFRRAPGPFQVSSGVQTDVTAPAVSEIFKELRGIVERPMSDEELPRAKDALSYSLPSSFEGSANTVNNLSNVFIYNLGLDYFVRSAAEVSAVTAKQATDAARKYLVPEKMVVIAVGDRSKIEAGLRELRLGPVEMWTAEGTPSN
jgi:zinc protease